MCSRADRNCDKCRASQQRFREGVWDFDIKSYLGSDAHKESLRKDLEMLQYKMSCPSSLEEHF
jgi:hypothetical protein